MKLAFMFLLGVFFLLVGCNTSQPHNPISENSPKNYVSGFYWDKFEEPDTSICVDDSKPTFDYTRNDFFCLINNAVDTKNPKICTKIQDKMSLKFLRCVSAVATVSKDPKICDYFNKTLFQGELEEEMNICKAASSSKLASCEALDDCYSINRCKAFIAYSTKKSSICEQVISCKDFDVRNHCYWWIAEQTKNSELCEQLPEDNIIKDWCLEDSQ